MEAANRAVTRTAPLLPPLAVIAGAARSLSASGHPVERIRALCDRLCADLPAVEVGIRRGAHRTDRLADVAAPDQVLVEIVRPDHPSGWIEVSGSSRALPELNTILDTVSVLIGALLPSLDDEADDADGMLAKLHSMTIDSLPVGLYVVDRELRVVLWNRKRETGTQGLRRSDVLGRRVLDVLRRQPPALLEAEFERIFATGEVRVKEEDVRVGDDVRTYRTTRLPMRLDGPVVSHVITIGEDVSETRSIQRAMHRSEKLAAVGQLAAGVMHEINNPLATIGGCVAAIFPRLGDDTSPVVREYLGIIESEVNRCTGIIEGLLDFSRAGRSDTATDTIDLNAVLVRTLDLLQHHQRFRRLQVAREFAHSLPAIVGNAERLVQAAMAILLNSADAMAGQGHLTLRTRHEAGTVVAEFEDDGPGIPAALLPRIFDPFFTTKGPARGTGLGLAICYGIVADHHGHIDVESTPGVRTTFRMTLPVATEEAA